MTTTDNDADECTCPEELETHRKTCPEVLAWERRFRPTHTNWVCHNCGHTERVKYLAQPTQRWVDYSFDVIAPKRFQFYEDETSTLIIDGGDFEFGHQCHDCTNVWSEACDRVQEMEAGWTPATEIIADPTLPDEFVEDYVSWILRARMERYANPDRCQCDGGAVDHSPDCRGRKP